MLSKRLATKIIILNNMLFITLLLSNNLNAFVTHSGNHSIWQLEQMIKANDAHALRTHAWLTYQSIKLFESYYNIDIPIEYEQEIIMGSIEEDFDIVGTSSNSKYNNVSITDILYNYDLTEELGCKMAQVNRTENHFDSGSYEGLTYGLCVDTQNNISTSLWANGLSTTNLRSWTSALEYGYNSEGFRSLGHVLHLLQDLGSPAHVRNDAHIFINDYHETTLGSIQYDNYMSFGGMQLPNNPEYLGVFLDRYFNSLREFTSTRYFSRDTIFKDEFHGVQLSRVNISQWAYTIGNDWYVVNGDGAIIARYTGIITEFPTSWEEAQQLEQNGNIEIYGAGDFWKFSGPKTISLGAGIIKLFWEEIGSPPYDVTLLSQSIGPPYAKPGDHLMFHYSISDPASYPPSNIRLVARIRRSDPPGDWIDDPANDRSVSQAGRSGDNYYFRYFFLPEAIGTGVYDVQWVILDNTTEQWLDYKDELNRLNIILPTAHRSGDINNDDRVNVVDLGILLANWGSFSNPAADINKDGKVDVIDLGIMLSNWYNQ